MTKESYVKPDVSSEVLEPGALAQSGSGGTGGTDDGCGRSFSFSVPCY